MDDILKNYDPKDLTFEKTWLMFQETSRKFQETNKKMDKLDRQLSQKIDKLFESTKRLDNFVNNIAQSVEMFFIDTLKKTLETKDSIKINGYIFDDIYVNHEIGKKKKKKEIDIILINEQEKLLAIIEIKTKLHQNDLELAEKIGEFLEYDRAFSDYSYIFGVASFNIPDDILNEAEKRGIFVVKPNRDETTVNFSSLENQQPKVFH